MNNFNDVAKDTLDEWVYFLKNSEVKDGFKAKGLDKAKEKLRYEGLSEKEKKMYARFQENRRIEMSVQYTAKIEAKEEGKREGKIEGKWEGKQEKAIEIAKRMIKRGIETAIIAEDTGLSIEQIEQLRKE